MSSKLHLESMPRVSASSRLRRGLDAAAIARRLEQDILFGRLRPRERLIEDMLMQRFGAKRYLVRQALTELERTGIVTRNPNRGAAVRDFSTQEVEEIAELRETLHERAIKRMKLPGSSGLVTDLVAIQHRHDRAVAERRPVDIDRANEAFHACLFAACGNQHLVDAIAHYASLSRAMRLYPMLDTALLETLRSEHWAMIEAIRKGDRRSLLRLVAGHIQHSKRLYLAIRITEKT
jgi:DNA-binding GntR family transcriptional regulator